MKLSQIFAKPIDRTIEGVIKADDDKSLRVEVDEYVVTNEVAKRLEEFFADYTHYRGANGVWVSGFFGSGKSHLLKMLALLLPNMQIDGIRVADAFLAKPGIVDNGILQGELKRAVAIPSESILFNIDQKADAITKQQFDALLAVFVKVFNEHCGYYGKQGYIAQFERDLDERGELATFVQAYQETAGRPWERGREQVVLEGPNVAQAYAQATGTSVDGARGILDKYRNDYNLSIEDFANQVNAYIRQRGPEFRLNFFVDEVGQYIADNTKLMTNLQTIAESLNTKCGGQAWIIVTAQEEMDTVVGEMTVRQSYDFSKIQARFANRIKLTSANVDEVINRRLLAKNDTGINLVTDLYAAHQSNLRTLFEFGAGSRTYRNYRHLEEFIETYPFVPYQYALFQSAIQNLSLHNAFEGRHSSVGERSMLSVFQHVIKEIADHEVSSLAGFDRMYAGIRNTLKGQITGSIRAAETQGIDPFAVQVLHALFLVKYVKEFKATARNLAILLIDSFDIDINAHTTRVQAALNYLEGQTYIQRNGDEYAYLTDEEKDVEQEIKSLDIDFTVISDHLARLTFDGVLKGDRKIRYKDQIDYNFSRKLDGRLIGREQELSVHVISPYYEHAGDQAILNAHSLGRDELYVILPAVERLMVDLRLFLQTDRYVQQNLGTTQVQSRREILSRKRDQNRERGHALELQLASMLSEATLLVDGRTLDVSSTDPRTRIVQGFHDLIARTYPNLGMLRGQTFNADRLADYLRPDANLLGDDAATFPESDPELLSYIKLQFNTGVRPTMQKLVNHFESKPYGWYLAAIQCILARLVGRNKVLVRRDGTILDDRDLIQALNNSHGFANLILEPEPDVPASKVRALKDFYNDFFDAPPSANEARSLGQETARQFQDLAAELPRYLDQASQFPFVTQLNQLAEQAVEYSTKPATYFFDELPAHADALLDAKEAVLAPIRSFMASGQHTIYLDARRFLREQQPNLAYMTDTSPAQLEQALDDPHCYRGSRMTQIKSMLDELRTAVDHRLASERADAVARLDDRWTMLAAMPEFQALSPAQQTQLRRPFDDVKDVLAGQQLIAVIRESVNNFTQTRYPAVLTQLTAWSQALDQPPASTVTPETDTPAADPASIPSRSADTATTTNAGDSGAPPAPRPSPPITYTPVTDLRPALTKAWLADEADVDAYLAALRAAMLAAIRNGGRIQL